MIYLAAVVHQMMLDVTNNICNVFKQKQPVLRDALTNLQLWGVLVKFHHEAPVLLSVNLCANMYSCRIAFLWRKMLKREKAVALSLKQTAGSAPLAARLCLGADFNKQKLVAPLQTSPGCKNNCVRISHTHCDG